MKDHKTNRAAGALIFSARYLISLAVYLVVLLYLLLPSPFGRLFWFVLNGIIPQASERYFSLVFTILFSGGASLIFSLLKRQRKKADENQSQENGKE